jgi:hypothetical protein
MHMFPGGGINTTFRSPYDSIKDIVQFLHTWVSVLSRSGSDGHLFAL